MAENICPQCKAPNRVSARFCAECGTPLLSGLPTGGNNTAENPNALKPGSTLQGRYRIERELGRGGFGAVYRAWDSNLNKACALKENLDTSPEAQRQFAREATVLANLSHPNLPRVTDHFSIPGQGQYLVMDFVDGEDLATLAYKQGGVPVDQALKWAIQVADALTYLHNRQPPVLHRDIKPANIRITPDGQAMLVDFGLVKLYDPHMKTTLGARAVTPGYAPPEQYGQGKTDVRSDIYALGATLYCVLTQQDPLESVQRIAGGEMLLVHQANPLVPEAISRLIERSMALEPKHRFQTAAEFKAALMDYGKATSPRPAQADRFAPGSTVLAPQPSEAMERQERRPEPASSGYAPGSTLYVAPESGSQMRPAMDAAAGDIPYQRGAQAPAQKGNKMVFGVAAGVVVLVCIVGALAVWLIWGYIKDNEQASQTETAQVTATAVAQRNATSTRGAQQTEVAGATATQLQATRVVATARAQVTSTARAQRTATAQARLAATEQAIKDVLGTAKNWNVRISDTFSSNENDWAEGTRNDPLADVTWVISGGLYRWSATAKDDFIWWAVPDNVSDLTDFYVSVDMNQLSGPSNAVSGLIFRSDKESNYYIVRFSTSGQYRLDVNSGWDELWDWTKSDNWVTGETNRVELVAMGSRFVFFLNGQYLNEIVNSRLTSGAVGLVIGLYDAGDVASWVFDNFTVRTP
ncbi:MAG: protein kinase [Anaerolineales bacterium]|nr:protein kinase [Anaerolineales bacterium]